MSPRALPLLLALSLLASACPGAGERRDGGQPQLPTTRVRVGMHVVQAEVADTAERKRLGLSHRPALAEGHGMLFPYTAPERPTFWMKDMHFPIDIVWVRGGRILAIVEALPHGELPPAQASPDRAVEAVLEVPAGTSRRLGWRAGDTVRWDPPT